jgi:excisionase family DNA binding protein
MTKRTKPDVTPKVAARLIGCSVSMVYKLIRAGELTHRRVGTRIRIPRRAIAEYKRRMTVPANPAPPKPPGYVFKYLV